MSWRLPPRSPYSRRKPSAVNPAFAATLRDATLSASVRTWTRAGPSCSKRKTQARSTARRRARGLAPTIRGVGDLRPSMIDEVELDVPERSGAVCTAHGPRRPLALGPALRTQGDVRADLLGRRVLRGPAEAVRRLGVAVALEDRLQVREVEGAQAEPMTLELRLRATVNGTGDAHMASPTASTRSPSPRGFSKRAMKSSSMLSETVSALAPVCRFRRARRRRGTDGSALK